MSSLSHKDPGIAVLNALRTAVFLLDRQCRIRFCNPAGRELLARSAVVAKRGVLKCRHDGDTGKLSSLVRDVLKADDATHRTAYCQLGAGAASLIVSAQALPKGKDSVFISTPVIMLLVRRPRGVANSLARLAVAHRFTKAEQRFALALIREGSVSAAARSLLISIHTGRTHLKSLLSKTGTHRQTDLIRLLIA